MDVAGVKASSRPTTLRGRERGGGGGEGGERGEGERGRERRERREGERGRDGGEGTEARYNPTVDIHVYNMHPCPDTRCPPIFSCLYVACSK